MEEVGNHRTSLDDDTSSVYQSAASNDGRVSLSSTQWDGDAESHLPPLRPASPFWLAGELLDGVSKFKYSHSRDISTASSKTLNGGSETDSQLHLDRQTTLADLLIDSAPHLRHLSTVRTDDAKFRIVSSRPKERLVTPVGEQRHPGKPGLQFCKTLRPFEPEPQGDSDGRSQRSSVTIAETADQNQFLQGIPLLLLTIGLSLVVFLISIDRSGI